jgi:hypothetical protein
MLNFSYADGKSKISAFGNSAITFFSSPYKKLQHIVGSFLIVSHTARKYFSIIRTTHTSIFHCRLQSFL